MERDRSVGEEFKPSLIYRLSSRKVFTGPTQRNLVSENSNNETKPNQTKKYVLNRSPYANEGCFYGCVHLQFY